MITAHDQQTLDAYRLAEAAQQANNQQQVARLLAYLDYLDEQRDKARTAPGALFQAAITYASHGINIFPLSPGTKIPFKGTSGVHEATSDLQQIRSWWKTTPQANIAIAPDHRFSVMDLDGPAGYKSYLDFIGITDPEPCGNCRPSHCACAIAQVNTAAHNGKTFFETAMARVSTPRGTHLYVKTDMPKNKVKELPGIDIRTSGGYVVAPPSRTVDGKMWTWAENPQPFLAFMQANR